MSVLSASSEPAPRRGGRLPVGAGAAVLASAAMIAQQVAGKATRDALFLSSFGVSTLPAMMGISALGSLLAVLWLARMMTRHTPAKVVPVGFGLSAAILLATWGLSFPAPRLAAVLLYLYTSIFGAAMISAFWSLINETYDPHTSRTAATAIASGGTLGGVLGGLAAWGMSRVITVPTMLPLLAGASLLSMWGSLGVRRRDHGPVVVAAGAAEDPGRGPIGSESLAELTIAPLRSLGGAPYLRNLATIVALGAITSGLLDYVFSAEATRTFAKGPALLSFFSCFWLVVGVVSFGFQLLFGKLALEKLGIAVTIALLPAIVVFGGAVGLAVPGLWSTALLRGGEATQRNSLFRAAYEMLYTPLPEDKKRSTKTLIDVGFDRIGTIVAAGIVVAVLALAGGRAEMVLLVLAVAAALVTLTRSRALHTGYVAVLEESLRLSATKADLAAANATIVPDEKAVAPIDVLPPASLPSVAVTADDLERVRALSLDLPRGASAKLALGLFDLAFRDVAELKSRDPARVHKVLSGEGALPRPVVPFVVLLLADDSFKADAIRALRKCVPGATGQLVDALCDETSPFDVRRRIPRVLSECPTEDAARGLLRAMSDERFEVRYECARALLKITSKEPRIVVSSEQVVALVKREVLLGKDVWASQPSPEIDAEEEEPPALIDRLLQDRIDRSMEHVFTLLALNLDRVSLRLAFKALHESDERLRGTALEYLETVLPDEVRDDVWPFLGEERPMRPRRPPGDILSDLRRVSGAAAPIARDSLAPHTST